MSAQNPPTPENVPDLAGLIVEDGRTVALVGFMGAGKSTIGRRLASRLGRPFHDSDEEIVRAAGREIPEIFETLGEAEFRRGEKRVIERLLAGPPHVLATGGGAFMDAETRGFLKAAAVTVWLRAPLDVIWRRVSRRSNRPLLHTDNPRKSMEELYARRADTYALADLVVDSRDQPHDATAEAVLAAVAGFIRETERP